MPQPVRPLPMAQNWDCAGCGDCCRSYHVRVTAAEKAVLDAHRWPFPATVPDPTTGEHRLAQHPDGRCVFLGADYRCRVHAEHGAAAKPMACRVYPFVLVPADGHWRVGLRYACPAAVAGTGRPLATQAKELDELAGLVEADLGRPTPAPPPLRPGQGVPWADLHRVTDHLLTILDRPDPLEARLRLILAVADLCQTATFEKVSGRRLTEFLELVTGELAAGLPAEVPPPSWVGRMIFRQTAAVYARADSGPHPGDASRSRWTRVRSAYRFAVGRGTIPKLHALIPPTTFAAAEGPAGPVLGADELLTRYYRVKVQSEQFAGPTHFGRPYWDGLRGLVLTFPVVRWLGRVFTTPERDALTAIKLALQVADGNFGYNPLLAGGRQAWAVRTLAGRGDLARLVAWYGR